MIARILAYYRTNKARIHRLSNEGGWIFLGQFVSVLGSFVLVRVLTEYLEPAEYGQLALGLTIAALVNQVVMSGVSNGVSRYYSIALGKKDLSGYLDACKRMLGYATFATLVIAVLLIVGLVALHQMHWITLAIAVLLFSIFNGYNNVLSAIQNAARQHSIVAMHDGFNAWLKIALIIGLIIWLGACSTNVALGYFLSAAMITISQLFFLKRLINRAAVIHHEEKKQNWLPQIWSFSWPFSAFGFFTWMQLASDRWALQSFTTTADVGQYVVVYQLGFAPIGLLVGLLFLLIKPVLYQKAGDATEDVRMSNIHRLVWQITKGSLLLTMVAFVLAWPLHAWLFQWLVAEVYRDASVHFPWMVLAGGFLATGQVLSLKLMSEVRSHDLLYAKIGSAVIGVFVNIIGALFFGVTGVVFGLLIFSLTFFAWISYVARHLPDQSSLSISKAL